MRQLLVEVVIRNRSYSLFAIAYERDVASKNAFLGGGAARI